MWQEVGLSGQLLNLQRREKKAQGKNREPFRILYLINSRRRKAIRTVEKILQFPDVEVTAVVGKEEELKGELRKAFPESQGKLEIHGWVKNLAGMIRAHDLVVTKPGTISVREVLATGRPTILVEGGKNSKKRKGICRLITRLGGGALAESPGEIGMRVGQALQGVGWGCGSGGGGQGRRQFAPWGQRSGWPVALLRWRKPRQRPREFPNYA